VLFGRQPRPEPSLATSMSKIYPMLSGRCVGLTSIRRDVRSQCSSSGGNNNPLRRESSWWIFSLRSLAPKARTNYNYASAIAAKNLVRRSSFSCKLETSCGCAVQHELPASTSFRFRTQILADFPAGASQYSIIFSIVSPISDMLCTRGIFRRLKSFYLALSGVNFHLD
jgi:hypothetical protein